MGAERCTDSMGLFLRAAVALARADGKAPVPDDVFGALMWFVDVKGGACGGSSFWAWRHVVLGTRQSVPCLDDGEPGRCSGVATGRSSFTSEPPLSDAQMQALVERTYPLEPGERIALGIDVECVRLFGQGGQCLLLLVHDPERPGHYGCPLDVLRESCSGRTTTSARRTMPRE